MLRYSSTSSNKDVSCSGNCEAQFPLLPAVNQYKAIVWAVNSQGELVGTPATLTFSKLMNNFLSMTTCGNSLYSMRQKKFPYNLTKVHCKY